MCIYIYIYIYIYIGGGRVEVSVGFSKRELPGVNFWEVKLQKTGREGGRDPAWR